MIDEKYIADPGEEGYDDIIPYFKYTREQLRFMCLVKGHKWETNYDETWCATCDCKVAAADWIYKR